MITILVTGGAGFIGSHYIKYLLESEEDIKVINLDALKYSSDLINLKNVEDDPRYSFIKIDLTDKISLLEVFEKNKIDQIVHFAAESHVDRSIDSSEIFMQTNILGTYNLIEFSRQFGLQKFIHISTDEVYGSFPVGKASEKDLLVPGNPYSASKASSDLLCLAYANTFNFPVCITRCTNNFGPHQHLEKFIPNTINCLTKNQSTPIYGNGLQERDWLYVTDHCSAVELVRKKGELGEIYNIGSQQPYTNLDIAKKIADILGKSHELLVHVTDRPGHDIRYCLDSTKINKELGWISNVSLDEGLKETIEWYL